MAWSGEVPLLGFEGEGYGPFTLSTSVSFEDRMVLYIPIHENSKGRGYGQVAVYAWSARQPTGEGYNIFFPNDQLPFQYPVAQARSPLDVKMIIQDFLQKIDRFVTHGEMP